MPIKYKDHNQLSALRIFANQTAHHIMEGAFNKEKVLIGAFSGYFEGSLTALVPSSGHIISNLLGLATALYCCSAAVRRRPVRASTLHTAACRILENRPSSVMLIFTHFHTSLIVYISGSTH